MNERSDTLKAVWSGVLRALQKRMGFVALRETGTTLNRVRDLRVILPDLVFCLDYPLQAREEPPMLPDS